MSLKLAPSPTPHPANIDKSFISYTGVKKTQRKEKEVVEQIKTTAKKSVDFFIITVLW